MQQKRELSEPMDDRASRLEVVFGRVLFEHRMQKGLTQEDVAVASDIDRTYVSLLERGKRQPSLSIIVDLARTLDLTPGALVDEVVQRAAKVKARRRSR